MEQTEDSQQDAIVTTHLRPGPIQLMPGAQPRIENLIREEDLLELFGIKKQALYLLRKKEGLPFLEISKERRLYLESDVMAWLISRRQNPVPLAV